MEHFKLKLGRTSVEHRRLSINVRSLLPSTNWVTKETYFKAQTVNPFEWKFPNIGNTFVFSRKTMKNTSLWCEDCRFVCFETGLGKPMLTLNDPNGLKKCHECLFYPSRTVNGIVLSNKRWKVKICQSMSRLSRYTRSTYVKHTMTSSNGNIFRVTGPLCGELASDAERWCFLWSAPELTTE